MGRRKFQQVFAEKLTTCTGDERNIVYAIVDQVFVTVSSEIMNKALAEYSQLPTVCRQNMWVCKARFADFVQRRRIHDALPGIIRIIETRAELDFVYHVLVNADIPATNHYAIGRAWEEQLRELIHRPDPRVEPLGISLEDYSLDDQLEPRRRKVA